MLFILLLVLQTAAAIPAAQPATRPATQPADDANVVWISQYGSTYHRKDCKLLKGVEVKAVPADAIPAGKAACATCKPDGNSASPPPENQEPDLTEHGKRTVRELQRRIAEERLLLKNLQSAIVRDASIYPPDGSRPYFPGGIKESNGRWVFVRASLKKEAVAKETAWIKTLQQRLSDAKAGKYVDYPLLNG